MQLQIDKFAFPVKRNDSIYFSFMIIHFFPSTPLKTFDVEGKDMCNMYGNYTGIL